eukprot:5735408-Alexandrium_andersonii.AAC.1
MSNICGGTLSGARVCMCGHSEGCSCAHASSARATVPMLRASADMAAACRMCAGTSVHGCPPSTPRPTLP